jgi:chemotaxis family two-component system sensor kinase Cph1
MKSLIDDLLIYSRVEREDSNMRMVDLQAVLDEALLLLEASVDEAEATFSHDPLPSIRADEHLMIQLFQNLISNALKYRGERKPVIHIGAKQLSGEWQFSVCDNGIGIEEIYLERIFVIFRRLHSQGEYSGTGIGLAVCKKAVEIHGGRIWAESEVGKGTTFFFTIPK